MTHEAVSGGPSTASSAGVILDPEQPLVDPHHHLWLMTDEQLRKLASSAAIEIEFMRYVIAGMRARPRYLVDELMTDLVTGHNVRATVYMEAGAMYRRTGPASMKSIGEIEFANGVAAMAASGLFGDVNAVAGIVGSVDLCLGAGASEVLRIHMQVAGGRYRGIRQSPAYDHSAGATWKDMYVDERFRIGFNFLHELGLSFDTFLPVPQLLSGLIDLARSFPETQIILNHAGSPPHAADGNFSDWRNDLRTLSTCENVAVKVGGIRHHPRHPDFSPYTYEQLATEWKPYVETCIEIFGADRCMFETDYPASAGLGSYATIWNAFKKMVEGASKDEQSALLGATARRIYRLGALT